MLVRGFYCSNYSYWFDYYENLSIDSFVDRNAFRRRCRFNFSTRNCNCNRRWNHLDFQTAYKGIMNAITVETSIPTENEALKGLFTAAE